MPDPVTHITLVSLEGPSPVLHEVGREKTCSIGRLKTSDLCLAHENVSRQHAQVLCRGGAWFIVDLDSKWGTFLTGVRLTKHKPAALAGGDLLRVGPWVLQVRGLPNPTSTIGTAKHTTTIDDTQTVGQRVERASVIPGAWRSDRRLTLLKECLSEFADEVDEEKLALAVLERLVSGSGYARGAVLRRLSDSAEVEIVVSWPLRSKAANSSTGSNGAAESPEGFEISRSLLKEAWSGQAAVLTAAAPFVASASLSELRVHSAICVPLMIGGTLVGFFYLDARGKESAVQTDAAVFCEAVGAAYALALANVKRHELEGRERLLEAELTGARAVQEQLVPSLSGRLGEIEYAACTRPGLEVAGDFVDVIPVPDGRLGLILGDVAGRGAAAGMHTAAVLAFLNAEISRGVSLGEMTTSLNKYLSPRVKSGRFVSVWLGFLASDGMLEFVDAGHGHWLIQAVDGEVRHAIDSVFERDIVLAVQPEYRYSEHRMRLMPGEKLVLYTDGITEQCRPDGEQFRRHRLAASVRTGDSPRATIDFCYGSLLEFAAIDRPGDDSSLLVVRRGI
jgi:serine phosphatase RsbU (regulator of sigma subunit)